MVQGCLLGWRLARMRETYQLCVSDSVQYCTEWRQADLRTYIRPQVGLIESKRRMNHEQLSRAIKCEIF